MEKKKLLKFSSRWGFVLSAVGSAVGMANVWGFPAKIGAYGSAFLVAYLIFMVLFSVVGLSSEYAIGRRARTGTLGSYQEAWATRGTGNRRSSRPMSQKHSPPRRNMEKWLRPRHNSSTKT